MTSRKSSNKRVVQGEGFEPPKAEPTDLQSAVFDRFTTPAWYQRGCANYEVILQMRSEKHKRSDASELS